MKKRSFTILTLLIIFSNAYSQRVNESFGGSTFPPVGWSASLSSGLLGLDATTNAYGSSSNVGAVLIDFYNVNPAFDSIETFAFSSTGVGDSLRFDEAYAGYSSTYIDTMQVYAYVGSSYLLLRTWQSSMTIDTGMTTAASTFSQFVPSSSQWRTKVIALPAGTTKIKFKFISGYGNDLYLDNIIVDSFFTATQTFDSVTCIQTFTNMISQGSANQRIMQIPVKVTGQISPMLVTNFSMTTIGTTSPTATLDSAKIFFTGSSSAFSTAVGFGAVASPNGTFSVAGSQVLANGYNYFWLAYDIKPTATIGTTVDATCVTVTVGGTPRTPNVSSPAGSYQVAKIYNFDTATNQNFTTVVLSGPDPTEWQRGTPSAVGPTAAFTPPNCWGTNLSGNYTIPSTGTESYALVSPTFVATATSINLSYREWYDISASSGDLGAFEYKINSGTWTALGAGVSGVNSSWNEKLKTLAATVNDTVQFRWNLTFYYYSTASPGWYIDNFAILGVNEIDILPPAISYTLLTNTSTFTNRTLNNFANITDQSGVDTLATNRPRIYYKHKTENNAFGANNSSFNGWKYATSTNGISPFSFVIDYSLLTSSPTVGDTLQYFVVAQDLSPAHNVGAMPSAGFTAATINSVTAAPTVPNYFIFSSSPLTGSYTVGVGQTYTTITSAINDLNLRGVSSAVTLNLTDTLYSASENFPITITNFSGASPANFVTIRPVLSYTVITGNATSLIKFSGAQFVKIDGAVSGTSRNLIIANTSTGASSAVIIASTGVGSGSSNDTIKNCILKCGGNYAGTVALNIGGAAYNGSSSYGFTPDATMSPDNANIGIVNNQICRSLIGLGLSGTGGNKANTIFISGNQFGSTTPADFLFWCGAFLANATNVNFTQNTIQNIVMNTSTFDGKGILCYTGLANSSITKNTIDSIFYPGTGGWGATGIECQGVSNIAISNNMITRLWADGWFPAGSGDAITGIKIQSGSGINIYYNTVNLTGTYNGYGGATVSSAFYANSGVTSINLKNNIFSNSWVNIATGASGALSYAFASTALSSAYSAINFNDYFVSGSQAMLGYDGASNLTSLGAIISSIGGNANSKIVTPYFISSGNAHLTGTSLGDVNLGCAPVGGITTDIDNQTRFATWHYMGADEIPAYPLPVKLFSFYGSKIGNDVLLNWTTFSEINNNQFIVQRSFNGIDFSDIGNVKGHGTTNLKNDYEFTDYLTTNNKQQTTNLFYRLQQLDFNGDKSFSKIISVNFPGSKISDLAISPNPFTDLFKLNFVATESGQVSVIINDLQGRTIFDQTYDVAKGINEKEITGVSSIREGIYFLQLNLNGETKYFKLMKN
ncbi:MAG: BNR-repeat neuraminidase N-terminal domain-containing protein [Bacteroidia bacterium]